jgi:predicted acetyltransferase
MSMPHASNANDSASGDDALPTDVPARAIVTRNGEACLHEFGSGARILTANAGDHPLILQLLTQARQVQLAEDFQSRLDEPNYNPRDRLLVCRAKQLLAHVHLSNHIAWFEGVRVPTAKLEDFAVLPEHADSEYDRQLLRTAETTAADEGAVLGLVRTAQGDWFQRQGWSPLRGQGHTRASARGVLAHLDAQDVTRRRRRSHTEVRTWRHFELDIIRTLYDQATPVMWGPLHRSEICWQWLLGRKAQDLVLLAVHRHKAETALASDPQIIERHDEQGMGYAVMCGSNIIEMITSPKAIGARVQLLAQACREAMDRDHHSISLYTPADDSLHELLVTAGGAWIDESSAGGPRWLMRLLSPERWVERCYPLWRHRARAGDVPRPCDLGIDAGEFRYRFSLTRRSSRLERITSLPADHITCDRATFDSLVIGNLAVNAAIAKGKLRLSRPELAAHLAALFPPQLFWQSSLESMRL